ncbi:hypothetical protein GQ53DRAFT_748530 [Thozetella sp. PMI_491]|nr:hypothetical protein GQ53DRAFT_748530 [Thozetella sp. PMI_491]
MSILSSLWLILLLSIRIAAFRSECLELTAVVSDEDGRAKFECWEMAQPFVRYPTTGEAIMGLADVSNVSYVVLPPKSKEGLHKPPHPMFFVLLSGRAHVTLPEGDDELWIEAGVNGFMIAIDIVGDGHYTEYPSDKPSVALQLPFSEGRIPEYRLVKSGVCTPNPAPKLSDEL